MCIAEFNSTWTVVGLQHQLICGGVIEYLKNEHYEM